MPKNFSPKYHRIGIIALILILTSFTLVNAAATSAENEKQQTEKATIAAQPPAGAPTQITFTILAYGSNDTLQFSLNGTSLGSKNSNPSGVTNCSAASAHTLVVNDANLISGAWSQNGANSMRLVKGTTNGQLAWVRVTLAYSNGYSVQTPLYDFRGGATAQTSSCSADYSSMALDHTIPLDLTDADDDGISQPMDCNESNASVGTGIKSVFYRDADGDGLGNPTNSITACSVPAGYVSNLNDCNDSGVGSIPVKDGYELKVLTQGGNFAGKHLAGIITNPTSGDIYVATNPNASSPQNSSSTFTLWKVTPGGVV